MTSQHSKMRMNFRKTDTPLVNIVVLNYKNYDDTIECLDSIFKVTYPNYEIIIVDNNSQNDSLNKIGEALYAKKIKFARLDESGLSFCDQVSENVILFQSPSNSGYAAGNNWGIKIGLQRKADFLIILNNDTIVKPDFIEPLVKFASSSERIGAVGPKIFDSNGNVDRMCARKRTSFWGYCNCLNLFLRIFMDAQRLNEYRGYVLKDYNLKEPKLIEVMSGACMCFKRSTIERMGLLDENTFLYLEEFIIAEKLISLGLDTYIVPESKIIHKSSGSTKRETSKFIQATTLKSRRYYMKEYRKWNWLQREFLLFSPPFTQTLMRFRRFLLGKNRN